MNAGNSATHPKRQPLHPGSPKSIHPSKLVAKRKLTNLDNYTNDDYDLDFTNVFETSGNKDKLLDTMPNLMKSTSGGKDIDDFSKSLMEI